MPSTLYTRSAVTSIHYANEAEADFEFGGKASALARLQAANLPIPAWFVVSPAAFTASLPASQRMAFSSACAACDMTTIETTLASIQLDAHVLDDLVSALAVLCPHGERVAVRSSALHEDGALHSFAGQFDTFLFVPPELVAERIIDVWRSGFSERILAYQREHGLDLVPLPPAVLVQRMVDAETSGVAFSADPVSGRRGIVVVSALYGLGTALVSGECDADTYTVDRSNTICSRAIAHKHIAHRYHSGEGVQVVPVAHELISQAALDDDQVRAVADLARRCERYFGCPQDIEWAIAGDELYLLQSRPVTSLAQIADPDGQYALWDNSNIAESYNGVTTPLTFSFARFAYEQVYRRLCRALGVSESVMLRYDDTFRHMIGLIHGRIYYNLLNWYRLLALMPGFTSNRKFMEQMMGVKEGLLDSIVAEMGESTWGERMHDRLRLLITVGALLVSYHRLPRDIRRFYRRIDEALGTGAVELEQMRPDELVGAYRSLERRLISHWDAPLVNDLFAMMMYGILRTLVVKWCGDQSAALQNDLLSSEGGIISAEPAQRVRKMAALASSNAALVECLCDGSLSEMQRAMAALPAFEAEYRSYLDTFADRCLEELKLESATLRDDPLPLLRSIGHLARRLMTMDKSVGANPCGRPPVATRHAPDQLSARAGDHKGSPLQSFFGKIHQMGGVETLQGETALRRQAEQRVSAALRGHPIRRLLFAWVLKQARLRVRDRENLRFERTRVFGRVRRIFNELGSRFHALGLLEEAGDIFYLEVEEALGFVTGTATTTDLKGLIALRKAEYARFKTLAAPVDRFETHGLVNHGNTFRGEAHGEVGEVAGGECRKGIGCCPGLVRGAVRIITNPKNAVIQAGEILVAERTDPGWIMLFPAAAGVLVERGSILSHSAIVARELCIPTVVALSDATHWLHDGDWVELDGNSGMVRKIFPPAMEVNA